jgi:hypothetical protein
MLSQGSWRSAFRAMSSIYGKPVASGKATVGDADATISSLAGGYLYLLYADNDCYINIDATATNDGACHLIPGGMPVGLMLGNPGTTITLHHIKRLAGGSLHYTKMGEVP